MIEFIIALFFISMLIPIGVKWEKSAITEAKWIAFYIIIFAIFFLIQSYMFHNS